jgi:hypothetical protein
MNGGTDCFDLLGAIVQVEAPGAQNRPVEKQGRDREKLREKPE